MLVMTRVVNELLTVPGGMIVKRAWIMARNKSGECKGGSEMNLRSVGILSRYREAKSRLF